MNEAMLGYPNIESLVEEATWYLRIGVHPNGIWYTSDPRLNGATLWGEPIVFLDDQGPLRVVDLWREDHARFF